MKIKRISTQGFMGESTNLTLTGKDLLIGVNGSGKTKVRNALEFALTGSIFKTSQNGMIFEDFSSAMSMECQVETNLEIITRGIEDKVKDGTHKFSGIYAVNTGSEEIVGQAKVDEYLERFVLPIAFTYQELMRMNSSDRRTKFFEMLQLEDPDDLEVVNVLNEVGVSSEIIEEILKKDSIDSMIALAKLRESYFNKKIKDLKGATKSIAAIKNEIDVNVGKLESINKEIESLRKQKEDVVSEIGIINQKNEINNENIQKKQRLQEKYDLLEDGYLETKKASLEDLKNKLATESDRAKANLESIAHYKDLHEKNYALMKEKKEALDTKKAELYELLAEKARLFATQIGLKNAIDEVMSAEGVCPLTNLKCDVDLSEYINGKKLRLDECNIKSDSLNKSHAELLKATKDLELELIEKTNEIDDINIELLSLDRAEKNFMKVINEINSSITETNMLIDNYHEKVTMLKERIDEIKIFENDFAEDKFLLVSSLSDTIKERVDQINSINEALNLFKAQQSTIREREETELTLKMWADSKIELNKLKINKMTSYLSPIEKSVTDLMQDAGFVYEFKFITETLNGDQKLSFGLVDGTKIATSLSTGEFLLAAIGMMIALNEIYQPKLRLLIVDEILSLDADSLEYLTNSKIIASNFDNVILFSPMQITSGIYNTIEL